MNSLVFKMRYLSEKKYHRYLKISILLYVLLVWSVVPFIHELGHVIALNAYDCAYWQHWEHGYFKELYGTVYSTCALTPQQQIWMYASGILLTFFIGMVFLLFEIIANMKHKIEYALIFLAISYAFLMDIVNYLFFPQGDVKEILRLLNKEELVYLTPFLGFMIIITMLTYLYISLHEELEVIIVKEESKIKRWMKRILRKIRKQLHR